MNRDDKAGPARGVASDDLADQIDAASRAADLANPDPKASFADQMINRVVEIAGVSVLLAIVALVFFNASSRYAFNFTFIWGDEMVIGLLPWLGMCGMFLSIRRRQIEFFTLALPEWLRRPISLFASVLSAAVFVYLAYVSFQYLQLFGGDKTIYLRLPRGWFTSALAIGSALAALAYTIELIRELRQRRDREVAP